MANNPYTSADSAYTPGFEDTYIADVDYQELNLKMPEDRLKKMLIDSLDEDEAYWQQKPWQLHKVDKEATNFLLGDQLDEKQFMVNPDQFVDNRLFSSLRAILSYATGQLAIPEITPSKGDDIYLKAARDLQAALYQHSLDDNVEEKTKAAVLNLVTRKRGILKLRFDPNIGEFGDIVTDVVPPEDVIVDRFAGFLSNPNKIYQRLRCTVDELISRFPEKKAVIYETYAIKRGQFSQVSRYVTYWECWYTYYEDNKPKEAVCWFIAEPQVILDNVPNPNWVYTGSDKTEKRTNITNTPPKPYVWFNYINTGHSFIDDTSLFEQAQPIQRMLNNRNNQLNRNIDFMNGRWIASKKAFSEADAQKFVNKGSHTVALVDADDVSKAIKAETPSPLPAEVYNSVVDYRNEIDGIMGTPSQFKGSSPQSQDTATRDLMIKQQAGMLQDDLVRSVANGMAVYYKYKAQMMRALYTDDYWFQTKGKDGKYIFVMINGEKMDTSCKISVQVDSTLPLDKAQIRSTAMELWQNGQAIDYRSLMEDLGMPNPEVRTERYLKQQQDPVGYMRAVETDQVHDDAEVDIQLIVAGKEPEERDVYDQSYLDYFNLFLTSNRFARLEQDQKQRLVQFLMVIQHIIVQSTNMQGLMLDAADQYPTPPPQPAMPVGPDGQPTTDPNQPPGAPQSQPPQPGSTPQPPTATPM